MQKINEKINTDKNTTTDKHRNHTHNHNSEHDKHNHNHSRETKCQDNDEFGPDGCSCHEHGEHKLEFPLNIPILCIGLIILAITFIPQFDFRIRLGLSIVAYIYFGLPIIFKMFGEIKKGEFWNENTLMTIATIGAFCIGEFADAAAVMILYSLGEYLQDMAFEKSKKRIQSIILQNPEYATVIRNGKEIKINPENVRVGEEFIVKPGEKIPLDGTVTDGGAYSDNSAITGESVPVSLTIGKQAVSGGIVSKGTIKIRADKPYADSAVSLISKAMKEASKRKSHTEKAITAFSKIYTPIVIILAAITVLANIFIFKAEILSSVKIGLIFLVVSCPCALVLSVPLTYFAGLGAASKNGILIKGGESLDSVVGANTIVFDKTGTVTKSDITVEGVYTVSNMSISERNEFTAKISAVMKNSNHPLCSAFTNQYKSNLKADKFEEIAGKGTMGSINGEEIICGNLEFMREHNINAVKQKGTVIYCAVNGIYKGSVLFSDVIKEGALNIVQDLKKLGIDSKNIYLMSGDNEDAVLSVSKKICVNSDNYFHDLKPYEKMEQLEKLISKSNIGKKSKNSKVIFVGDGLNDAAVLSRADAGIAIQKNVFSANNHGAGVSYAAIDAADIVIMDDKIEKVADIIKISKATRRIVMQNIIFALACKILILGINTFIYSSIELAILADVGVALICVLNALRVLKI